VSTDTALAEEIEVLKRRLQDWSAAGGKAWCAASRPCGIRAYAPISILFCGSGL